MRSPVGLAPRTPAGRTPGRSAWLDGWRLEDATLAVFTVGAEPRRAPRRRWPRRASGPASPVSRAMPRARRRALGVPSAAAAGRVGRGNPSHHRSRSIHVSPRFGDPDLVAAEAGLELAVRCDPDNEGVVQAGAAGAERLSSASGRSPPRRPEPDLVAVGVELGTEPEGPVRFPRGVVRSGSSPRRASPRASAIPLDRLVRATPRRPPLHHREPESPWQPRRPPPTGATAQRGPARG